MDFSALRPLQTLDAAPIPTSPLPISMGLFHTLSLSNKSLLLHDHEKLDIMFLTETWHHPVVYSGLNEPHDCASSLSVSEA